MNDKQLNYGQLKDKQLIELCKNGDKHAFESIIRKYYLPLNRFFYKLLHNSTVCEDLTHDVIIKLIVNIEKYRPFLNTKFSTWLFRIAHNTYIDYCKKSPYAKEVEYKENEVDYFSSSNNEIHDRVIADLERKELKAMIEKLPGEMRALIILKYYNDFSYSEIGKIIGISPNKVKWKLYNSVERLKKSFSKYETQYRVSGIFLQSYNGLDESELSIKLRIIASIFSPIAVLSLIMYWLFLPLWVFMDARKREFKAPLWAILVLVTNAIGLIIYLVVRPEFPKCKNCGEQLNNRFVICPYCGQKNGAESPDKDLINQDTMNCKA